MKLFRKILSPAFVNIQTSGITEYHFADTNPDINVYEDVTDIETIIKEGKYAYRDFKFIREQARAEAKAIAGSDWSNWNTLSEAQKDALSTVYLVPEFDYWSTTVFPHLLGKGYTSKDIGGLVTDWDKYSRESRENRYKEIRTYIANNIGESKQIFHDVVTKFQYDNLYLGGIEGTVPDGLIGLFDFIDGTAGTKHESSGTDPGIRYQTLTSSKTSAELADDIMAIIREGNYTLEEIIQV